MSRRNENSGGEATTEEGVVWRIKVGVQAIHGNDFIVRGEEKKRWEIKIILN